MLLGSPANCIGSRAMSAKQEAQDWAEIVSTFYVGKREPVP